MQPECVTYISLEPRLKPVSAPLNDVIGLFLCYSSVQVIQEIHPGRSSGRHNESRKGGLLGRDRTTSAELLSGNICILQTAAGLCRWRYWNQEQTASRSKEWRALRALRNS